MEHETKRQWMQSYEGRIRVGPQYQAMIPPFCRNNFASSQFNGTQDYPLTHSLHPSSVQQSPTLHSSAHPEQYIQSYDLPDDSFNDTDICSHLKFDGMDGNSKEGRGKRNEEEGKQRNRN
ncbi:hypothetical protein BEWA_031360 [Theileria equi strain WA]|uniref:ELM2 domain-containing protein n=1 Tax=Theileria equi strain WA TaxID=1537102 RepID=L0AYE9_THEEQ|nr:hypothetical protein BEWA_031360 [Theileria equi strain WA]AFZ80283.1 hypothetical protein BEWA_031360 [Theileria equi strain WA]|eukprot:XP_004829949.1 hypothetical protein BEWA_031360 [Theileria equi strain WA]